MVRKSIRCGERTGVNGRYSVHRKVGLTVRYVVPNQTLQMTDRIVWIHMDMEGMSAHSLGQVYSYSHMATPSEMYMYDKTKKHFYISLVYA